MRKKYTCLINDSMDKEYETFNVPLIGERGRLEIEMTTSTSAL